MDDKELDALREEIRKIDKDMVVLFEDRLKLSREIAKCKMKANIPIYDAEREEKNIEELSALLQETVNRPYFVKWYHLMMDFSKKVQKGLIQGDK